MYYNPGPEALEIKTVMLVAFAASRCYYKGPGAPCSGSCYSTVQGPQAPVLMAWGVVYIPRPIGLGLIVT